MDKVDWTQVLIVFFTNLAAIIGALAGLLAILIPLIRSGFEHLGDKVDGHFSKLIDVANNAKELGGKVDTMMAATGVAATPKSTPAEDGGFLHKRKDDSL